MATPVTVQRSFDLPRPPAWAWDAFFRVAWVGGAGFGPRPDVEDPGDAHGIGHLRSIDVLRSRPLRERIEDGCYPRWLTYRVLEPGWPTFPVRWHRGTIAFDASAAGTRLTWTIEFEPLPLGRWPATILTSMVMHRYRAALVDAAGDEDSTLDPMNR